MMSAILSGNASYPNRITGKEYCQSDSVVAGDLDYLSLWVIMANRRENKAPSIIDYETTSVEKCLCSEMPDISPSGSLYSWYYLGLHRAQTILEFRIPNHRSHSIAAAIEA